MGFDNECILNIQSLAGEYFCPVCRTLVYPNEALQTQCTHLYCKPCLTYVVNSTQACPYDGYLVTEAGSKPLVETNKILAETIGKIAVHCLYHRSGCTWQGPLSECTGHCSGCAFGNSPVVCNRCGIQIVHRQVQEHAQTCSVNVGTNPQSQQGPENVQDAVATSGAAVSVDQSKIASHTTTANPPPQAAQPVVAPSATQNMNTSATAVPQQALPAAAVPTPEQWYQQQYQQYYQQYPGYDPYQQAYQQYYPYQQQGQQFQQPAHGQTQNQVQGQLPVQSQPQFQQHMQPPMQLQPQAQPHSQMQAQPQNLLPTQAQGQPQLPPQPQNQSQAQPPVPSHGQPQQQMYPQAAAAGSTHNLAQSQQQVHAAVQTNVQSQSQPPMHGQMPSQPYSQVQTHPIAPQRTQLPQYQQTHPHMIHPQPSQAHPHPQAQSQLPPQGHPQFQPHPQLQPSQYPNSQHPPGQSVAGYPPQFHQQIQQAPPPQHPMQVQHSSGSLPPGQVPVQFSQPPAHVRPPQPSLMPSSQGQAVGMQPVQQPVLPVHQRPVVHQVQQPAPQQYVHQTQASAPLQGQIHHSGHFAQQHPQVRPQGPPQPMQQPPLGYVQSQLGTALAHGMPPHSSQSYVGRSTVLAQGGGGQSQQFPQSSGPAGIAPHSRPPQFGSSQPPLDPNNANAINPLTASSEQQVNQSMQPAGSAVVERKGNQTSERTAEQQEDKSPSLKKPETATNGFGVNEVKPEIGKNDEDNSRQDAPVTKDAVSEVQQVQGVSGDSTMQKVNEEGKDNALDHSSGGKTVQNTATDMRDMSRDSIKSGDGNVNMLGSTDIDKGSLAVPPGNSQGPPSGRDRPQDRNLNQSQNMSQVQVGDVSGGFQHSAAVTDQGRFQHPPIPYGLPGPQQRPTAPLLQQVPPTGQVPLQHPNHLRPPGHGPTSSFHSEYPFGGPTIPGSASMMGRAPNNFANQPRTFEPLSAGSQGQYNQVPVPSSSGNSRMSQAEQMGPPIGSALPPRGPESQTGPHLPMPTEADLYQSRKPPHFDGGRPDSHVPGNLERGPYAHPYGIESNTGRMNGVVPAGVDPSSAPVFHDEKCKAPSGERIDTFLVGPPRAGEQVEIKESAKQFPRPHHLGSEASPGFGNSFPSRPVGAFGVDGPSRPHDKDAHGYNYDAGQRILPGSVTSGFLPHHSAGSLHPNDSGGRPLSGHDDNRGRLDNDHANPDFQHGFGRHHMDRLPPGSTVREYVGNQSRLFGISHGNEDLDGRERNSFGGRFPTFPPGHARRGELDGPVNMRLGEHLRGDDFTDIPPSQFRRAELFGPRNLSGRSHVGEPGFGSFQDYGRSGEPNRPGSFSHQQPFGESFGAKSTHPRMGEPGFRSTYSHQAYPNDRGFYAGVSDSFDNRKRKSLSMGWCRICKVDCESVEGLDIHGQTREHQRMAMDMVKSIKQKTAKKHKTSHDHSVREEPSVTRSVGLQGRGNKP